MPEGPSILIIKDIITPLCKNKKIISASGNAKINMAQLAGKKVTDIRCWGKQLLIYTGDEIIRIHFLMFGSYSIDENHKPARSLRLALQFPEHIIYFFTCSVKLFPGGGDNIYDWEADVLSDKWNPVRARKKIKAMPKAMVCDVLLDQQIFSGVGNIIKNEVLYRIKLHPENLIKNIPSLKLSALIKEARNYSFDFLKWKREFTLKKHWLAHTKKICLRCDCPITKKYCGKTKLRTFFCTKCQVKYPR